MVGGLLYQEYRLCLEGAEPAVHITQLLKDKVTPRVRSDGFFDLADHNEDQLLKIMQRPVSFVLCPASMLDLSPHT